MGLFTIGQQLFDCHTPFSKNQCFNSDEYAVTDSSLLSINSSDANIAVMTVEFTETVPAWNWVAFDDDDKDANQFV